MGLRFRARRRMASTGSARGLVQRPGSQQHHRRVLCRYESNLSFEVVENSIRRFSGLFPMPVDVDVQPASNDAAIGWPLQRS